MEYSRIINRELSEKNRREYTFIGNAYIDVSNQKLILKEIPEYYLTRTNQKRSLKCFNCSSSEITKIPKLPLKLQSFYCGYNNLTSLPELPSNLLLFRCNNNSLLELPKIPKNIQLLDCSFNELTSLPKLPNSLNEIYVNDNPIKYISRENLQLIYKIVKKNLYLCINITNTPFFPYSSNNSLKELIIEICEECGCN